MIELSTSRPDIVTEEQVAGYQQQIKDAQNNIKLPASYMSYSYNWESQFVNQIGGASMPKMNTLTILVMNGMSEKDMLGRENKNQTSTVTVGVSSMVHMQ